MGILAPLYFLGILAVGVPILLHLIRRTPQGRQMFSSLMFLAPSPPRLTKRSRLSNVLLLILRAAAIALLAFAFARPYFHWGEDQDRQVTSGRRIIFLLDSSASMRRPDLWADAKAQVEKELADITPADEVGLYVFDRRLRPAFSMAQWNEANPGQRLTLLRAALGQISPTWSATRVGDALAAAADLASENNSSAGDLKKSRTIILVSDLQEGAKAQALQGHEWPKDVTLKRLPPLTAKHAGNASIQWVEATPASPTPVAPAPSSAGAAAVPAARSTVGPLQADGTLRVRIANEADSAAEQFTLAWHNSKGPVPETTQNVYVAPGHSQIVKVPLPADGTPADRLVLTGDGSDFDNTLYIVPPQTEVLHVLYAGEDAGGDVNGLRYYLESALFDTPLRKLDLMARGGGGTGAITAADLGAARLAVVARALSKGEVELLRKYVDAGNDVLWVGKDVEALKGAGALVEVPVEVTESGGTAAGEYALLSRVDLTEPLFAPFADARFADFSKIHFWKHRQVKWDASLPRAPLVRANFDNGDPFLIVARRNGGPASAAAVSAGGGGGGGGGGNVYVLTSGWQPSDSQLALSSKFLPLMEQLVKRKDSLSVGSQFQVEDAIPLDNVTGSLTGPDGKAMPLAGAKVFTGASEPGIYHLQAGGHDTPFAVNLAPEESRTRPVSIDDFGQWGVQFTSDATVKIAAERERVLLNNELENKQKRWRWILLAVLGLLAVETALAGRLSRSATPERAAT
jgi:hypothetical protein